MLSRSEKGDSSIRLCEEFHKVENLAGIMTSRGFRRKRLDVHDFDDSDDADSRRTRSIVRKTSIAIARRNESSR
jgi:hypothetical protein